MNKKFLILLLFVVSSQSFALLPPALRCISVLNDGKISLNWMIPTDIAGFNSYHLYRSNALSGVYVKIDTIFNVNQTSYIDLNVNANNQTFFYYIQCRSIANVYTSSSDTLQSIRLVVTNTGTGLANLSWNAIHTPSLPTTSAFYQIYKSNALMLYWTKVDSVQNLQYNDTVKVCHDTVSYRIEIKDASNCYSISSVDGKLFEDHTPPFTNGMDTVSVNYSNHKVIIGWKPSPSMDTWGYIICHGSPCLALDTVFGRLTTIYIDSSFDPCASAQTYRIAAFDSCYNTSLFSNNHTTIKLSSQLDICANEIALNWTPYINMSPATEGYKVFMSQNGGVYTAISTNNPSTLNYTLNNIADSSIYCFYIQAFESIGNKTSSSCEKCYKILKPLNPQFLYIRTATVVSDNQIDVKIHADPLVGVSAYNIFKSKSPTGPFNKIASLSFSASSNYVYSDYSVNTQQSVYFYKVENTDSCENPGITSNTAYTIHLTATSLEGYVNKLEWTAYGDWAGNVASYSVFRTMSGSINALKIAEVSSSTFMYLDDIQNFTNSNGSFVYFIIANENPNSIYNFVEESSSNKVELLQSPEMYIPNAFVPDGLNKVFKPVMAFVNSENYLMQIYNHFGQLIFDNNNPEVGWDGKYEGITVPSGVYVYLIRYSKPNHDIIQKKGIVTLLD